MGRSAEYCDFSEFDGGALGVIAVIGRLRRPSPGYSLTGASGRRNHLRPAGHDAEISGNLHRVNDQSVPLPSVLPSRAICVSADAGGAQVSIGNLPFLSAPVPWAGVVHGSNVPCLRGLSSSPGQRGVCAFL